MALFAGGIIKMAAAIETPEQVFGPLRSLLPLLTGVLVSFGADDKTAGVAAGGLVFLATALWSWWSNKPVNLAKDLVRQTDVTVRIGPAASSEMKAAAADPKITGIVTKLD
jgi:hypothetical protein